MSMQREFQYHDATSAKFWRITCTGNQTTIQFGRIGTNGQTQNKTHASAQAAQQFAEKQIAEKLKKGYSEVATTATPEPAPSPVPEPAPTSESEPVALPSASDEELALEPTDWFWANWRKTAPLPRPTSQPPFDKADALKRLRQVVNEMYSWGWNWHLTQIPPLPSREEAHFWLIVLSDTHIKGVQKVINKLTNSSIHGNLSAEEAYNLVPLTQNASRRDLWVNLMTAFMPLEELFGFLYTKLQPFVQASIGYSVPPVYEINTGLHRYVLPYLTEAEREKAIASLPQRLDISTWPDPKQYRLTPPEFHFAAMLGSHQADLLALINSWSSTLFNLLEFGYTHLQRPQDIILGLQDPQLVIEHMQRLKLRLFSSEHIAAWLAHTEFSHLDLVRDAILAEGSKDSAAELLKTFAASRSPKMAVPMLELMLQSRAPQLARAWLDAHPHEAIAGLLPLVETRHKLAAPATEFLLRHLRRGSAYAELIAAALVDLPANRVRALHRALFDAAQTSLPRLDANTTPAWLREALGTIKPAKRKPTTWLEPAELPVLTVDQYALNDQQREALLEALRQSTLDEPHPFIVAIKQHLDPEQLDSFAWALFENWLIGSGISKENWAMAALGLLGNDTSARKLTPMIRVWRPSPSASRRACTPTITTIKPRRPHTCFKACLAQPSRTPPKIATNCDTMPITWSKSDAIRSGKPFITHCMKN
jgi:predicted DNA-binding WGR domain protein